MRLSLALAALLLAGPAAQAEPRHIPLDPPASEVAFRAYGLGLVPIDGNFTRFEGWLVFDSGNRASCRVELHVRVDSLVTDNPSMRDRVIGSEFMDAGSYPGLSYAGTCDADGLGGTLVMHGVTRPFRLALDWRRAEVVAEGRLVRADWGMTALPFLGGRTVRIRVSVPLGAQPSHGG